MFRPQYSHPRPPELKALTALGRPALAARSTNCDRPSTLWSTSDLDGGSDSYSARREGRR